MDEELAKKIGRAAREARTAQEWSLEDASEHLGISAEFLGRIERGKTLPSTPTLVKLARVLGVSADAMLGLETLRKAQKVVPPEPRSRRARVLFRRLRSADDRTLRVLSVVAGALLDRRARPSR